MIDTKLSDQMSFYIKQAAESAARELWTAVNSSIAGGPHKITDLTSESVKRYCDVVSEIIVAHINEELEKEVKANTRRIVLGVFDKLMNGNGHEHS